MKFAVEDMPMTEEMSPEKLCESVYSPPRLDVVSYLEELVSGRPLRYFDCGRRALVEALRISGVKEGETVALPGLICRDLLPVIRTLGAKADFYPVARDLHLAGSLDTLPPARAVVAVNYFGFAQELAPFQEYCRRTGAVLVEDNAHGLFSYDPAGRALGTRGDFGIFSFRKTVPVPNGAALVMNTPSQGLVLRLRYSSDVVPDPLSFRMKETVRRVVPIVGHRPVCRFVSIMRGLRRIRAGLPFPVSRQEEAEMPRLVFPGRLFSGSTRGRSGEAESRRRRALYVWLHDTFASTHLEMQPVFPSLPDFAVPFGYPFYAVPPERPRVDAVLRKVGLFCYPWPELPDAVKETAPEHYRNLLVVPFLW